MYWLQHNTVHNYIVCMQLSPLINMQGSRSWSLVKIKTVYCNI